MANKYEEMSSVANRVHESVTLRSVEQRLQSKFRIDIVNYLGSGGIGMLMTASGQHVESYTLQYMGIAFTTTSLIFAANSIKKLIKSRREVQNLESKIDQDNKYYEKRVGHPVYSYK